MDRNQDEIDRWALAATLFGARISATIAERTFASLEQAGVHTIADAERRDVGTLIELLDAGGYARYDLRTSGFDVPVGDGADVGVCSWPATWSLSRSRARPASASSVGSNGSDEPGAHRLAGIHSSVAEARLRPVFAAQPIVGADHEVNAVE